MERLSAFFEKCCVANLDRFGNNQRVVIWIGDAGFIFKRRELVCACLIDDDRIAADRNIDFGDRNRNAVVTTVGAVCRTPLA